MWAGWAYDLSLWCPACQVEDVDEFLLLRAGFGELVAGFGATAGGGGDQHGFLDAGQLGEQFPHGRVQAGVGWLAAHEVGEVQGEDAGVDGYAESVVGPG